MSAANRSAGAPGAGTRHSAAAEGGYRNVSFWMSTVEDDLTPLPPLGGDVSVDVAIVGAGLTGLWTAYYLSLADPGIRVAVVESEIAGFGASGRNGGWCSALFPQSVPSLARQHGRDAAVALHRAMVATVDEVGRAATAERIDCDFAKGGTVVIARTPIQLDRARSEVAESDEYGLGVSFLGASEARARLGATGVLGGTYTPNCAAIHPAKLVRGLSAAVRCRGVTIYEQTRVLRIEPRRLVTSHGTVTADHVVRATEGYTARLDGMRREIAPVYSMMIATEPLPPSFWESAGLGQRETFSDYRHLIIYGQRTADDRLAFGGRGAPYHFGSTIRPEYDRDARVHTEIGRVLAELFPGLRAIGGGEAAADWLSGGTASDSRGGSAASHSAGGSAAFGGVPVAMTWGGPLGIPRDWSASVGLDRATGLAWAGGYVGDGVATTNLAGRTLADLIRGVDSDITRLPWVNRRSPRWEPEPLRWLGVNAGLWAMSSADAAETRTGRPSRRAALVNRLRGHVVGYCF